MDWLKNAKQPTGNTPGGIPSRHILFLDDEKAVRDATSRLLKARGHQCTTAPTGEVLLEILEQGILNGIHYDLAILDIKVVGGMGGIETMRRIRQVDDKLPVLSMSGYSADSLFGRHESSGFAGHLEKPFSANFLALEIERLCPVTLCTDGE